MFVTLSSISFAILLVLVTTLLVWSCLNSTVSGFCWLVCICVYFGYLHIIEEYGWILSTWSGISLSFSDVQSGWLIFFVLVTFSTLSLLFPLTIASSEWLWCNVMIISTYLINWSSTWIHLSIILTFSFISLQRAPRDHVWKVCSLYLIL